MIIAELEFSASDTWDKIIIDYRYIRCMFQYVCRRRQHEEMWHEFLSMTKHANSGMGVIVHLKQPQKPNKLSDIVTYPK